MKVALDGRRGKIRRKRVNVFSPKRLSTGSHAPPVFLENDLGLVKCSAVHCDNKTAARIVNGAV